MAGQSVDWERPSGPGPLHFVSEAVTGSEQIEERVVCQGATVVEVSPVAPKLPITSVLACHACRTTKLVLRSARVHTDVSTRES